MLVSLPWLAMVALVIMELLDRFFGRDPFTGMLLGIPMLLSLGFAIFGFFGSAWILLKNQTKTGLRLGIGGIVGFVLYAVVLLNLALG